MTYPDALRYAIQAVLDADLDGAELRTAFRTLIPKEHHADHNS